MVINKSKSGNVPVGFSIANVTIEETVGVLERELDY